MDSPIRKISVGIDPKNSMHYIVGGSIGNFVVTHIVMDNGWTMVYVCKTSEPDHIYKWKSFNPYVPITHEHYI